MRRSNRLKLVIEGPLALALLWEGHRTGEDPNELAMRLLHSAASDISNAWRLATEGHLRNGGPKPEEVRAARVVLDKAYGPLSKRGKERAPKKN